MNVAGDAPLVADFVSAVVTAELKLKPPLDVVLVFPPSPVTD